MEIILEAILSYLISLAANFRTDEILSARAKTLKDQLERQEALRKALSSVRSLRDEFRAACAGLARNRRRFNVTSAEEPLWQLLGDVAFQGDLLIWLRAGAIEEGDAAKNRLLQRMESALDSAHASPEHVAQLRTSFFDTVDKMVFTNPVLAHWRHQLSLDYLREQVAVLRRHAEEAAGTYSPAKQALALERYCEKALAAWDIIDLSNLPEGDVQMATQTLLLRQLYMPLRIDVEIAKSGENSDAALTRLEQRREARRHREAGHVVSEQLEHTDRTRTRSPVGERLRASRRLVVLGDPGGGKTTMLRWLATAYLLRHKGSDAYAQLPDTQTLPSQPWIPVLIRCRDLGEADLCRCFTDFLAQHLKKTELLPEDADIMRAVILDRIARGEALLLVDGLDEITSPQVRMMFCQELERTAARYPDAPMVVVSRIVGYRDMPYRMGTAFEHSQLADLSRDDKDLFVRRWVDVTEQHHSSSERAKRAQELLDALHSSDRIERLTGNPMLLTTLALVKRKVGKLPNRRNKLYAEAVSVLLNWNPRLYQTIDDDEALPQLAYVAYDMCRRGVQQLTDDDALDLLERLRVEYPNIRSIRRRTPREFLDLLEARSSLLIRSGGIWQDGHRHEKPVWEFRHLTFQEYLAARALLDGRYPGRSKTQSLAQQVRPLAGTVQRTKRRHVSPHATEPEIEVLEPWREALRLLVADCKDDDVDEVLIGVLTPLEHEDAATTRRARAVLAALCLADEPNVSELTAQRVLLELAESVSPEDGNGVVNTSLDRAALELAGSSWLPLLKVSLMEEFWRRPPPTRWNVGGLWGMAEGAHWKQSGFGLEFFADVEKRLSSRVRLEETSAALAIMEAAYEGCIAEAGDLPSKLLVLLAPSDLPLRQAAAWALGWLSHGSFRAIERDPVWVPKNDDVVRLSESLETTPLDEDATRRWLATILGYSKDSRALPGLVHCLDDPTPPVRIAAIEAVARIGDQSAVPRLLTALNDSDPLVRRSVVASVVSFRNPETFAPLLAALADADPVVRRTAVEAIVSLCSRQRAEPPPDNVDVDAPGLASPTLGAHGHDAIASLIARVDDPDLAVRKAVIQALSNVGGERAVPALAACLDDRKPSIRVAIADALGRLGNSGASPALLNKLGDPDVRVRTAVIGALRRISDEQIIPSLIDRLDDPDTRVRRSAIRVLGQRGDKRAVESLLAKLDEYAVRVRAIEALGRLGDKRAVPHLVSRLGDPDVKVRRAVAEALGRLRDERAASSLGLLIHDSDPYVRREVVGALEALGDKASIEFLTAMIDDHEHDVCAAAAAALVAHGVDRGTSALADCLGHPSPERRIAAVRELVRIRARADERILLSQHFDGDEPWIDPRIPITNARMSTAAQLLQATLPELRLRYASLADDFQLTFS